MLTRKVIFDVDDTLWPYTRIIADSLGIDYASWIDFHNLNPKYDDQLKDKITRAYCDPSYYRQLEFYPGFSEIMQLEQIGARLQFNSKSFTQETSDLKRQRMIEAVPDLRPDQFVFSLHDVESNTEKEYDDDALIIVDDNHYSVAKSKAPYAIMPIQPWNQTPKARAMLEGRYVSFVPAGKLELIYGLIDDLLFADGGARRFLSMSGV